jgi:hypothetical protein
VLNVSEISEVSGLSPATVSAQLNRAGIAPAKVVGKRKLFDAPQALRLLLGGDELDPKKERARLDCARASLTELELEERRGSLVDALDVQAMGAAVMTGVTMRVMAIRNIAPEIRAARSDAEGAEILEDAAREALAEIARLGTIVGEINGAKPDRDVDGARASSLETTH